jgi:hypothetical protein
MKAIKAKSSKKDPFSSHKRTKESNLPFVKVSRTLYMNKNACATLGTEGFKYNGENQLDRKSEVKEGKGYLHSNWSDEGVLTQVNRSSVIAVLDTRVVCVLFKPDVSGTWESRARADDASYVWVDSNVKSLERYLNKTNDDGSVTLTAGVYYAIKAMIDDRGGGDAFRIAFSGPVESTQSAELGTVGRDGTGFCFHNPYAPNSYNLNS